MTLRTRPLWEYALICFVILGTSLVSWQAGAAHQKQQEAKIIAKLPIHLSLEGNSIIFPETGIEISRSGDARMQRFQMTFQDARLVAAVRIDPEELFIPLYKSEK